MEKISSTILKYSGVAALAVVLTCAVMSTCCKKGKVVVLDHQKILTTAAPFQTILGEEKKYLNAIAARQAEDEKSLQIELALLQKKIKDSGKKPEAFQKEVVEFQKKVAFYNEKYRALNGLIARANYVARQQLDPYVNEVLKEMGEEGYTVILPKQGVTYSVPQADVTDLFIKKLNAKDVKIAFPDPAQLAVAAQTQNNQEVQPAATDTTSTEVKEEASGEVKEEASKPAETSQKKETSAKTANKAVKPIKKK